MHHPGGGRGPIGKVVVTTRRLSSATFPNWAPAFAGGRTCRQRVKLYLITGNVIREPAQTFCVAFT